MLVRGTVVAFCLAVMMVVTGLLGSSVTRAGGRAGGQSIVFGAALSLTGTTATEGQEALHGYQLWEREINQQGGLLVGGRRYYVRLRYYDDRGNPARSAQLIKRLVTVDKVNFLLGPYSSAITLVDEAVAAQYRVPMVEGGGASTQIFTQHNRYIFGVISLAPQYGDVMIKAALTVRRPPHTVAIIYATDPSSEEVAHATRAYAELRGIRVVKYASFPSGSTDLTAVMTAVKATAPDMLVESGHAVEAIAAMKAARTLQFNPKLYALTVGPATHEFRQELGGAANDVISSAQWTVHERFRGIDVFGTPARYARLYMSVYGRPPAYQAAEASAAGLAFQYAIEKAGTLNRQQVRNALTRLRVQTFFGLIRFDAAGANVYRSMAVIQIQDGKIATVYPPSVANATMIYPTPPFGQR